MRLLHRAIYLYMYYSQLTSIDFVLRTKWCTGVIHSQACSSTEWHRGRVKCRRSCLVNYCTGYKDYSMQGDLPTLQQIFELGTCVSICVNTLPHQWLEAKNYKWLGVGNKTIDLFSVDKTKICWEFLTFIRRRSPSLDPSSHTPQPVSHFPYLVSCLQLAMRLVEGPNLLGDICTGTFRPVVPNAFKQSVF